MHKHLHHRSAAGASAQPQAQGWRSTLAIAALAVGGWLVAGSVSAASPSEASGADAASRRSAQAAASERHRQERAVCLAGRSAQDRATCLKEADAALVEARRGRLDNGEPAERLQANALRRCASVAATDRDACELLARGGGTRSGSVAEGAVLKQTVTRSVGAPPVNAAASAAASASAP